MLSWIFSNKKLTLREICLDNTLSTSAKIKIVDQFLTDSGDLNFIDLNVSPCNILVPLSCRPQSDLVLIKYLLNKGAKIECNGFSALHSAIEYNNSELVTLYLDSGANLYFQNQYNNCWLNYLFHPNPQYIYQDHQRRDMIDLLLAAKLDINKPVSFWTNGEVNHPLEILYDERSKDLFLHIINKDIPLEIGKLSLIENIISSSGFWGIEAFAPLVKRFPVFKKSRYIMANDSSFWDDANLLELCVYAKSQEYTEYLLDHYPQLKADSHAKSLVYAALTSEFDLGIIEKLLKATVDINRIYRMTPPEADHSPLLNQYLDHAKFTDVNKRSYIYQALELLLKYGANPNAEFVNTGKAYEMLVWSNLRLLIYPMVENKTFLPEFLDLFLQYGMDINKKFGAVDEPTLLTLCQRGSGKEDQATLIQVMEYLLTKGLDLSLTNIYNTNYVSAAAISCRTQLLEWLINQGGDIFTHCGHDNSPILHKAISTYWWDQISGPMRRNTVELLLRHGAKIEEFSVDEQFTPLMCACYYGAQSCVEALLEHGANPNAINAEDTTPALCAVIGGSSIEFPRFESTAVRILRLLQQYGADLTTENCRGNSPLVAAIEQEYKEIFEALLQIASYSETQLERALEVAEPESYFSRRLMQHINGETMQQPTQVHAQTKTKPISNMQTTETADDNAPTGQLDIASKKAKLEVSNAASDKNQIPTLFDLKTKVQSFFKLIAKDPDITVAQFKGIEEQLDLLIEKLNDFSFFRNQATQAEFEESVQEYIDDTVGEINKLIEDDYPALTEALVDSVWTILQYFRVDIEIETALRKRFW
ncbi:ankyrin repeat domain-containing protein [Shewanella baltica]|uniref:Ankyrin domain protein n=1 Tax=Shewanella baltica (strain OS155 / ATCC BAA-1091) TaxID=325240 RepID=A3D0M4_SHEB5|nr:ankyrin repeat domain-containing protein [Shewanella baltica]ABN60287.1 ankyrin domain protein [Shewanella baltica OS155]AEH12678.1 Ankyrin [Shewanella baltica OS117]